MFFFYIYVLLFTYFVLLCEGEWAKEGGCGGGGGVVAAQICSVLILERKAKSRDRTERPNAVDGHGGKSERYNGGRRFGMILI